MDDRNDQCPQWCELPPGHEYDAVDPQDPGVTIRMHSLAVGPDVQIICEERNDRGTVELLDMTFFHQLRVA